MKTTRPRLALRDDYVLLIILGYGYIATLVDWTTLWCDCQLESINPPPPALVLLQIVALFVLPVESGTIALTARNVEPRRNRLLLYSVIPALWGLLAVMGSLALRSPDTWTETLAVALTMWSGFGIAYGFLARGDRGDPRPLSTVFRRNGSVEAKHVDPNEGRKSRPKS